MPRSALPPIALLLLLAGTLACGEAERIATVARTPGLIAFWDFILSRDGSWTSHHDPQVVDRGYPVRLRRIGDPKAYTPATWPYDDAGSRCEITEGGPFGKAVRFNQGFIFAEVPRADFDGTPLDLTGTRSFTLLAWTRFTGKRHLVAGVWDEGGWDRYGGRRQFALFGGLFASPGVIAHISATGAASFPQSEVDGAQYARIKAIDAVGFANERWVCMGMTFDQARGEVRAWLDGVSTPRTFADPVMQDVTGSKGPEAVNPAPFAWPIYGPRAFLFKFNGYRRSQGGIGEHALHLDLERGLLRYARLGEPAIAGTRFQVHVDVQRDGRSLLTQPVVWTLGDGDTRVANELTAARLGDAVVASLWSTTGDTWQRIGKDVSRTLSEGAPFTFGRALGLGAEERTHGSQLQLSGVAVFNRVLTAAEMAALSFADPAR